MTKDPAMPVEIDEVVARVIDLIEEAYGPSTADEFRSDFANIPHLMREIERYRTQLEIDATIFEEYGRLHRAKLHDGTPTTEWLAAQKKAERNEQHARDIRAALSPETQEGRT